MSEDHDRRRFLRLAGAGAAIALTGCSELTGDGDTDETPEPPPEVEEADVPDSAVTAFVEPDREELQGLQADLQERIEDGEIDRMEAQQELQDRQLELVAEEVEVFEEYAAETDGLTVEESIAQAGAILIDGDPAVIQTALNDGEMDGLLPGKRFVEISQQATQGAAGEPVPDGDAPANGTDEERGADGRTDTGNDTGGSDG